MPPRSIRLCKYAGGKGQLLDRLLPFFAKISPTATYFEPFVGGGSVLLNLRKQGLVQRCMAGDANPDLIAAYLCVRDEPQALIELLRRMPNTAEEFARVRDRDPNRLTMVDRAARFMYLVRTCYNGLWRIAKRTGQFNTPFGNYKNPKICDPTLIDQLHQLLQGVQIYQTDFSDLLAWSKVGDYIYIDPPYASAKKGTNKSFTAYTQQGFTDADQQRLAESAALLAEGGRRVVLSNADVPLVWSLYADDFYIHRVTATRAINSDGAGRGRVGELIISSFQLDH